MSYMILDIETIGFEASEIADLGLMPEFSAPPNYKDPIKIQAVVDEKVDTFLDRAALDATVCRIAVVGIKQGAEYSFITDELGQGYLLESVWEQVTQALQEDIRIIVFCGKRFDFPVLMRRSWAEGISVPSYVKVGRYFNPMIVDLADEWACGVSGDSISLARLCAHLGVPGKLGHGSDFPKLWASDKDQALEYLKADLDATEACAFRMLPYLIPAQQEEAA